MMQFIRRVGGWFDSIPPSVFVGLFYYLFAWLQTQAIETGDYTGVMLLSDRIGVDWHVILVLFLMAGTIMFTTINFVANTICAMPILLYSVWLGIGYYQGDLDTLGALASLYTLFFGLMVLVLLRRMLLWRQAAEMIANLTVMTLRQKQMISQLEATVRSYENRINAKSGTGRHPG
ncbi:MAG: hypothetical protein OHK0046_47950 [Anaerolineae bacterium]